MTTHDLTRAVRPRPIRTGGGAALAAWLFNAPALVLLLIFLAVPFGLAIFFSFTNFRLGSPLPLRFVGVENYTSLFSDAEFLQAFANNVIFAVVVVPVQCALALGLAILVNQKIRGIAFFRALFFMPVVLGGAVVSTIWFILMDPSYGLLNGLLRAATFGQLHLRWLQDPNTALASIIVICIWGSVGFQMVILLAGLQDIPSDLYEAAQLDGAGTWAQFRSITLPGLRNTIVFVVTMTTIFAFRLFDQVFVLTHGGPLGSTNTMLLELVKVGYDQQLIGRACAIAVVFFLAVVAFTLLQRRVIKEDES
ncbi:carbohydrate ABC transporter permease [Galbitalea soli]|uniref:Sugar ABC transporter permease n=1 Tax=Galbitalea soli TaxID=1268042 RepID=A0A7C9TRM0_9MICO|nr:sugar ABC transporter permease [Galbitalea soli]NEM92296.1 sugar ABC transporter permease [Galbitalea soli]NYJ31748.1 multiple sugar transport system permease protein [Galbitalea soli]